MFYYLDPVDFSNAITISELYALCQKYDVESAKITVYDSISEDYAMVTKRCIYHQTFGLFTDNGNFKTMKFFCVDFDLPDVYEDYKTKSLFDVPGVSVKQLYDFAKDNNMLDYYMVIESESHPWILKKDTVGKQVREAGSRKDADHFILCFSETGQTDLLDSMNNEIESLGKMVC